MRGLNIKLRTAFNCPTGSGILWVLNRRIPIVFKFVLCWFSKIIASFVLNLVKHATTRTRQSHTPELSWVRWSFVQWSNRVECAMRRPVWLTPCSLMKVLFLHPEDSQVQTTRFVVGAPLAGEAICAGRESKPWE